jgi:hypothetical protein
VKSARLNAEQLEPRDVPAWFAVKLLSTSMGVHGSSAANVIASSLAVNSSLDPDGDGIAMVDAPNEREAIRAAFAGAVTVDLPGNLPNQNYSYINPTTVALEAIEHKPFLIGTYPYSIVGGGGTTTVGGGGTTTVGGGGTGINPSPQPENWWELLPAARQEAAKKAQRDSVIPDLRGSITVTVTITDPKNAAATINVNVTIPNTIWVETKSPKNVNELRLPENEFQIARTDSALSVWWRAELLGKPFVQAGVPKPQKGNLNATQVKQILGIYLVPTTQLFVTVADKKAPDEETIKFAARNGVILHHAKVLYQYVDQTDKTKGVFFKVDKAENETEKSTGKTAAGDIEGVPANVKWIDAIKQASGLANLPEANFAPFAGNQGGVVFRKDASNK